MERLFTVILIVTVAVFFLLGAALYRMGEGNPLLDSRLPPDAILTTFVMDEPRPQTKAAPPRPRPVEKKIEDVPPVDLTKKQPVVEEEVRPVQRERQVRQVYGIKQVFSQGLGVGGDSDDAIVGRIGNTLDKAPDTLTATADDLKGRPSAAPVPQTRAAAAAQVTKRPQLKSEFRRMKPQYSQTMLQNRVEGVVRARLLIGSDGAVREVEIVEDIGYDSAAIAKAFLMELKFDPAMRGDDPVSVWIPFSIRFELI